MNSILVPIRHVMYESLNRISCYSAMSTYEAMVYGLIPYLNDMQLCGRSACYFEKCYQGAGVGWMELVSR